MIAEHQEATAAPGLPALYCPLLPHQHPDAADIDKKAADWMASCPIPEDPDTRARLLHSGCSRLLSNSCPQADIERLEMGSKWYYFAFAYDDWFESRTSLDEIIAVACAMHRALEVPGSALTKAPFMPAFLETVRELRRFATPTQHRRLTDKYGVYAQALPWEASYRLRGRTPDLNTHATLRLNVVGSAYLTMMEICNGEEIPAQEYNHPAVQALHEMTALLMAWLNDLYSVAKDAHDGAPNNLVTCLQQELRCSPQVALTEAVSIWNRTMLLFLHIREQVAEWGSPQLNQFLDDCGRAIGNTSTWHAHSPRYSARPVSVVARPPAGLDAAPVDIPSISWWWQQTDLPPAVQRLV